MNNNGEVTGEFRDANGFHGFLRDTTGTTIRLLMCPEESSQIPINDNGDITGEYDPASGIADAFIRHSDGSFTTFSAPTIGATVPTAINDNGSVCTVASNDRGIGNEFSRDASGNLSLLSGSQPNSGGACVDLNNNLRATGTYIDSSGVSHAWVK